MEYGVMTDGFHRGKQDIGSGLKILHPDLIFAHGKQSFKVFRQFRLVAYFHSAKFIRLFGECSNLTLESGLIFVTIEDVGYIRRWVWILLSPGICI